MGFDQVSQDILGISAEEYANMSEQEVQELLKKIRFKEVKLRLVTKSEVYLN